MKLRAILGVLAPLLVAGVVASDGAQPAAGTGRVFEMRTYITPPGRLGALNARFRDHTVALFKKHGMEVVGFWEPVDKEAGAGEKLVYLLAHKSRAAAEASWKAFREDPAWLKARADSEAAAGGTLTAKIESVFLTATDYSAIQ